MAAAESGGVGERPVPVTEGLTASAVPADPAVAQAACDWDAGRALAELYAAHYQALVRLAALLVRDKATAEEVVQDSFVAMYASWRRLRDSGKASSYLRRCVVNRSRSVLRHRVVVESGGRNARAAARHLLGLGRRSSGHAGHPQPEPDRGAQRPPPRHQDALRGRAQEAAVHSADGGPRRRPLRDTPRRREGPVIGQRRLPPE